MKTQNPDVWTESQHTFVKRWTIAAISLYGVMLLGMVAVIAASNGPRDNSDEPSGVAWSYDSEEVAVPSFQPGRMSQLMTKPSQSTDGYNNAANPTTPANAAPAGDSGLRAATAPAAQGSGALVENGWDFTKPDSIPGFGSMPQPGATPSTDENRLTARTNR